MFNKQNKRSPKVRHRSFSRMVLDLLLTLAVSYWASPSTAELPCYSSLISSFCSSPPCYVIGFLQILPHGRHPCLDSHFRLPRRAADFHRLDSSSRIIHTSLCAMLGVTYPSREQSSQDFRVAVKKELTFTA